jgi:hypothetical protein
MTAGSGRGLRPKKAPCVVARAATLPLSRPASIARDGESQPVRSIYGWYARNVLELDARDIALHFGHQDGGELVRKLYGHADARLARERVREAFRQEPPAPVPLASAGR